MKTPRAFRLDDPDVALGDAHRLVVAVVELVDDLERPATVEDVPADDLPADECRLVVAAGFGQRVGGLPEQDVGVAQHLVDVVQTAPDALDPLPGLGHLADRGDHLVGDRRGPAVFGAHPV